MELEKHIRNVNDFPKPGIAFKDVTPLLQSPAAFDVVIGEMSDEWAGKIDAIAALDARGFIFGGALALSLRLPFIPVRKKGKLPFSTIAVEYGLEYGQDAIEMHTDACKKGAKVLIVDDLLATGGTAAAAAQLIEKLDADVAGFAFVIELQALGGRAKLGKRPIQSLVIYP